MSSHQSVFVVPVELEPELDAPVSEFFGRFDWDGTLDPDTLSAEDFLASL
jgi:hypothetical protein